MFKCYEEFEDFISKRITNLRQQKNISARDMSLSLGLAEAYINHIENKNNMPSMKGLYYICEFLGISPKDFFDDGTEAPELISELEDMCKRLDKKSLENLLEFVRNTQK